MPYIMTPEGKVLGQCNAIMKYICKQAGKSVFHFRDQPITGDGIIETQNTQIFRLHIDDKLSW